MRYTDDPRESGNSLTGILGGIMLLAFFLYLVFCWVTGQAQCTTNIDEPFIVTKGRQTSCDPVMAFDTQEVRIVTNFPLPAGKCQQIAVTYSSGQEVYVSIWDETGHEFATLPASRDTRTEVISYNHAGEFIQFSSGEAPEASWLIVEVVCFDEVQQAQTVICLPVWISSQGRRVK